VSRFVQLDHLQQLLGALVGVVQAERKRQKAVAVAQAPQHAAAQVLEHAELGKDVGDLEAARQARRLISKGFLPSMRWPCSSTSPLLGAKRPLIRLNSVLLPAPLGPMMATRSPGAPPGWRRG
jgi:hypothetical protein